MDINFYQGPDGLEMIEFAAASPEELQQYARALSPDLPEGMYRDVRKSSKEVREQGGIRKVPTLVLGAAKIGERLRLPTEAKAMPQDPIPKAVEIPQSVKDADDKHLEVMAAKNGVEVTEDWRKRNRPFRMASVAKAMQTSNAR